MPLYLGSNKIGRVDIIKHLTTDNIQLEQKTVEPLETTHTYYPSGDYDAFSQFTVNGATLQIKTVSPSSVAQQVVADSGKYDLKQVNINPMNLSDKEYLDYMNLHYIQNNESKEQICKDLNITENQMYKRNAKLNIHRPKKLFQKQEISNKKYKFDLIKQEWIAN